LWQHDVLTCEVKWWRSDALFD